MAIYAIGDIQGCYDELRALLDKLQFDDGKDQLWLVGDLVNRGPDSLGVLRFIHSIRNNCVTVLGNHDLHLLALRYADTTPDITHNLQPILDAEDADELLSWLRQQHLAHYDAALDTLMVHAGVATGWDGLQALQLASEVEKVVAGDNPGEFLTAMYGREPVKWSDDLRDMDRLRCITNHLTRLRYVDSEGVMDFDYKGTLADRPAGLEPWFDHPDGATGSRRIVFGHWSALGYLQQDNVISLDTGCVWGDRLTALQLDLPDAEPVSVPSKQPEKF